MRPIGRNIRDLRTQKNITQEALAEMLFVTRQTVSNYETGRSQPDVEMLMKIADALGADANALIYGPPVPPSRRAALIRIAVGGGIFAALLIATLIAVPIAEEYHRHFKPYPAIAVTLLLFPALRLVGGWCVPQILALLIKFEPPRWKLSVYIRWALLILLAAYLLSVGAYLANIEIAGALASFAILHTQLMRWVMFFVGAALWVFGFPRARRA